ncbi:vacuolar protein sorting/targeting protein PEP1 [Komagataella kurtzmanii]|nr:vacuolar protein sorting/targeting protein PEP1 [Komagataella kurtzmanii]
MWIERKLIASILLFSTSAYAAFKPRIVKKEFDDLLNPRYFNDSSTVLGLVDQALLISNDDGKSWTNLQEVITPGEIDPLTIVNIEFNPSASKAFVFTASKHYLTLDKGSTWKEFQIPLEKHGNRIAYDVEFNFVNEEHAIIRTRSCKRRFDCKDEYFYSLDDLQSVDKITISDEIVNCQFSQSSTSSDSRKNDAITCVTRKLDSNRHFLESNVLTTLNFFKDVTSLPASDPLTKMLIKDIRVVQNYIVLFVSSDRYNKYSPTLLFISKDGNTFKEASLPDSEGTSPSVHFLKSPNPNLIRAIRLGKKNSLDGGGFYSEVLQSDSTGLHFHVLLDHLEANLLSYYQIENLANLEGIWIANQIDTSSKFGSKSVITFDAGLTWSPVTVDEDEDKSLHIIAFAGENSLYESKFPVSTPGIALRIGLIGDSSDALDIGSYRTFLTRDAGLTWSQVFDNVSVCGFGNYGNIILCCSYDPLLRSEPLKFRYSLDQGLNWESIDLGFNGVAVGVLNNIDNSSPQFLVMTIATDGKSSKAQHFLYSVDFSDAYEKKICDVTKDELFEEWTGRIDPVTKLPICVNGHKEKFRRRKADAECFSGEIFQDLTPIEEPCDCDPGIDYECSLGFEFDAESNRCEPNLSILSSHYCVGKNLKRKVKVDRKSKVAGTKCRKDVKLKDNSFTLDCSKTSEPDLSEQRIVSTTISFEGSPVQYIYLKQGTNTTLLDETVILRTSLRTVYVSHNGGTTFDRVSIEDDVSFIDIYTNHYFPDNVYLITDTDELYVSDNRAISFQKVDMPSRAGLELGVGALTFHMSDPNKFIWFGEKDCNSIFDRSCQTQAYITEDNGLSFKPLLENVRSCYFVGTTFDSKLYDFDPNLIFCEQKVPNQRFLKLVASKDYFYDDKEELYPKIIGIATTMSFVIVATINEDNRSLKAFITADGSTFAEQLFPADLDFGREVAYTVIDNWESKTPNFFFHLTTSEVKDLEFGALLKSNYNGTTYTLAANNVNRNDRGYVDYEIVLNLNGIALINTVINSKELESEQSLETAKKLKTQITYNDGSEWAYLKPPTIDSEKNKFSCVKDKLSLEKCSLNLKGATDRPDSRDSISSGSAVGLLFGVGNVGKYLNQDSSSLALYFSKDAGISWKEIAKGDYMWEFGDQGTILVIVEFKKKVDTLKYSLDEGETWFDYKFANEKTYVLDLATVPSDTSRKFIILANRGEEGDHETVVHTIDFSKVHQRQCLLNLQDSNAGDDFEYWSPKNPSAVDGCMLGHEESYLKRIASHSDCFIGNAPLSEKYKVIKNCACTRRDYECDYNFALANDGTCKLVEGESPLDYSEICRRDPTSIEYFLPTGYRKVGLSTCEGGLELDNWNPVPCPGKTREFNRKYGTGATGYKIVVIVAVPLLVLLGATWFLYEKGIKRNGGFARFGVIRLGEDDDDDLQMIEENNTDKVVNVVVKGLIHAFRAVFVSYLFFRKSAAKMFGGSSFSHRHTLPQDEDSQAFLAGDLESESGELFRYASDDDDAREIDSVIEGGIDVEDDDEENINFDSR